MKRPDYITQINMFHEWCSVHSLPPLAKLLWYELMQLDNLSGWTEWFEAGTAYLMNVLGTSRGTLIKLRKTLEDAGFLYYKSGKRGHPGLYKMNFLCRKNGVTVPNKTQIKDSPANESHDNLHTQNTKNKTHSIKDNEKTVSTGRTLSETENGEKVSNIVSSERTESLTENTDNPEIVSKILFTGETVSCTENGGKVFTERTENDTEDGFVSKKVFTEGTVSCTVSCTENDSLLYNNYKTETETEREGETGAVTGKPVTPPDTPFKQPFSCPENAPDLVMDKWNEYRTGGMSRMASLNDFRRRMILSKCKRYGFDTLMKAIEAVAKAQAGNEFRVTVDWLIKAGNVEKALNGDFGEKTPVPEKTAYGDFRNVLLTADEVEQINRRWSGCFDAIVEKLGDYKASSGKTYKSDFAAIKKWVAKAVMEDRTKAGRAGNADAGDYLWSMAMKDFDMGIGYDTTGDSKTNDYDTGAVSGFLLEA